MAGKEIIEYLFKGNPTDLLQATRKVEGGLKGVGTAGDKASRDVDQSFSRMASGFHKVGQKMQSTGKALTIGVTLPLVYALKNMADAAIEDQESLGKLEGQLQRTTGATRDQLDAVNKFIDKTSIAKGVVDDELRPAFEKLARATGSTKTAQEDLNLALDVSRATGKDLDAVTSAMAKAYNGNEGALGKLGIATKDAEGKTLDLKTIMENMNRQFGGAANDWANSAAGRAEIAKIKFGELQESLGAAVVPVMEDLVEVAGWVIDKFTALPDWVQKSIVAFVMFKGPIMWLGGTGVKLIGDYIAKLAAAKVAAEVAGTATAGFGTAASGVASGGMLALTTGAGAGATALGFKAGLGAAAVKLAGFLGQGLGLASVVTYMAPVIEYSDRIGESWGRLEDDGFTLGGSVKEVTGFFAELGEVLTGTGPLREASGYIDTVAGWIGINTGLKDSFNSMFPPIRDFFDLFANGDQGNSAPDDVAFRWAAGFKYFNDIVATTPGNIDPARQKLKELADASGWTEEQIEGLNEQFERFTEQLGFIDTATAAKRGMEDLATALAEAKIAKDDDKTIVNEQVTAYRALEDQAKQTAETMVKDYTESLKNGTITEEQAAQKKAELLAALQKVKSEAPQVSERIDQLTSAVNRVPTYRPIEFALVGVEGAIRGADRLAEAFRNVTTDARNARVAMSVPDAFRGGARGALGRAAGGTIGFARGGVYPQNSGGGITDGLTYVLGEGRNPREYVIPTDPQYSKRAQSLLAMASSELGVPRQQVSSTFAPTINVSGGSDPQATAAAVADAVEQAFARKKRREGSLAFT